jgi:hypothetical protein
MRRQRLQLLSRTNIVVPQNYGEEDEPLKQTRCQKILKKRGKLSCV